MKKYRPILLFIPITFIVNLGMTMIFMKDEFSTRPLPAILITDFIESIVGGLLFGWMWNYWMKRKEIKN